VVTGFDGYVDLKCESLKNLNSFPFDMNFLKEDLYYKSDNKILINHPKNDVSLTNLQKGWYFVDRSLDIYKINKKLFY